MQAVVFTLSDASAAIKTSNVYPPDNMMTPFNVSIAVLVTGTATYTVQYTFDNVFASGYAPASGNWTDHPTLTTQTTTRDANVAYPVSGLRIRQTAGNGSVRCTFIQAGGGAS
jgi:hypothetical protein